MDAGPSTSEIVESTDEIDAELKTAEPGKIYYMQKSGNKYSIEDDINRLFEAIDGRTSSGVSGFSREIGRDALWKRAMKIPVTVGSSHGLGIGISEPVSLKQALRGLSISQASEMAAMKKRLSKPADSSGFSEAGTIRRLYRAVVVEENGSGVPLNKGKGNVVEISLVPEKIASNSFKKIPESLQVSNTEILNQISSPPDNETTKKATTRFLAPDQIVPFGTNEVSKPELKKLNSIDSSAVNHAAEEAMEIGCSSIPICVETPSTDKEPKGKLLADSPVSSAAGKVKSIYENPRLIKPVSTNKSFIRMKTKQESTTTASSSNSHNDFFSSPITSYSDSQIKTPSGNERKENMKVS